MKKLLTIIILFSSLHSKAASDGRSVYRFEYGKNRLSSSSFDNYNTKTDGYNYGLSFGTKAGILEASLFFKKLHNEGEIVHDGASNTVVHDQSSYGIETRVLFNHHLHGIVGYGINQYTQTLAKAVATSASKDSIYSTYNLKAKGTDGGIFYGAGFDLFGSQKYDVSLSIVRSHINSEYTSLSAQVGIRLYLDFGLSDLFQGGN